jgi:hypothetical protein
VRNEWYIEPERLRIDYSQRIGSGAFSMVYKGTNNVPYDPRFVAHLEGSAPVCRIFPSFLVSRSFSNCDVAVKTLPPFVDDTAKSDFIQVLAKNYDRVVNIAGDEPDEGIACSSALGQHVGHLREERR